MTFVRGIVNVHEDCYSRAYRTVNNVDSIVPKWTGLFQVPARLITFRLPVQFLVFTVFVRLMRALWGGGLGVADNGMNRRITDW